jgi:hypothetical protein
MWIKLRKPKTETQLLKESVQKLECKVAVMEAVGDLQNELFESGLVNEGTNKILEKLKAGVMKLCPSPEKLKDFFKKMGEKVDAKMQNCKVEAVKNAWNTLKGIVGAQDSLDQQIANGEGEEAPQGDETQPTDDGSGEAQGDETGNEQDNPEGGEQEDIAAESLYDDWEDYEEYDDADYEDTDDGYEDWSEYGNDEYEDEYEEDEYGKWYDYSYFEATGKVPVKKPVKKAAPKKAPAKKAPAKNAAVKKPVAKKPAAKKPAAKKPVGKKAPTKKAPAKKVAKKGAAQAQGQEEAPQTKKQKILQWLKAHWKQVALILLIAVGMYFGIGWLMGAITKSAAVATAAGAVSKFRMPFGMKELPPGAKLVGNGVVKFANGGMLACGDGAIDDDF